MKELEKLLNSLVERGRNPFNYIWTAERIEIDDNFEISIIFITWEFTYHTLRDLVVLESWLWQFCVENELTHSYNWDEWKYTETFPWDYRDYPADEYQYRLLESALIPEEELGQFLIDNIVVQWKN